MSTPRDASHSRRTAPSSPGPPLPFTLSCPSSPTAAAHICHRSTSPNQVSRHAVPLIRATGDYLFDRTRRLVCKTELAFAFRLPAAPELRRQVPLPPTMGRAPLRSFKLAGRPSLRPAWQQTLGGSAAGAVPKMPCSLQPRGWLAYFRRRARVDSTAPVDSEPRRRKEHQWALCTILAALTAGPVFEALRNADDREEALP